MIYSAALQPTHDLQVEIAETKTQFTHESNIEFFEWWSYVRNHACPYRHQFDITEHPHWASRIFLVRIESADPAVFRFHLVGNGVIDMLGRNDTGTTLSESGWDLSGCVATHAYKAMLDHKRPLRFSGSLSMYNREYINFESIDAPFLGQDDTVSAVIGLICRV